MNFKGKIKMQIRINGLKAQFLSNQSQSNQ